MRSSSSYYNSSSYSPYGTSSYTTSATSPWTPRTSSQLRSTMSSPSTSSYVTRTHLPFVPQSTLVAHCFTGVQSSTRPYGYSSSHVGYTATSRPSSIRSSNSGYTSSLSRPQSTKRSNYITSSGSSYESTTSPSPSSSMFESSITTKSGASTPVYKPSSYLSSTTYSTSASTSASRSTHRTRPLTPSSYAYRPIRLRERPVLTHIWRQLNTRPNYSRASYSSSRSTYNSSNNNNNFQAPEVRISEPTTSSEKLERQHSMDTTLQTTSGISRDNSDVATSNLAKPIAVKEEEWSSDITRVISRNKYLIKFREIDKQQRPSDSAKPDPQLGVISELEPSVEDQIATKLVNDLLTNNDVTLVKVDVDRLAGGKMGVSIENDNAGTASKQGAIHEKKPEKEESSSEDVQMSKAIVDVESSKKQPSEQKMTHKTSEEMTVDIRIPIKLVGEAEANFGKSKKIERELTKKPQDSTKARLNTEKLESSDKNSKKLEAEVKESAAVSSNLVKPVIKHEVQIGTKSELKPDLGPQVGAEPNHDVKSEVDGPPKKPEKSPLELSSNRRRKASSENVDLRDVKSSVIADEESRKVGLRHLASDKKEQQDDQVKVKPKVKNQVKLKLKPVRSTKGVADEPTQETKPQEEIDKTLVLADQSQSEKTASDGSPKTPESPKPASKTKMRKVAKRRQSNATTPPSTAIVNDGPRMHPISPDCDDIEKSSSSMLNQSASSASDNARGASDKTIQMSVTRDLLPPQSPPQVDKKTPMTQQQQSQRIRFRQYSIDDFNFLSVLGHGGWGFVILAELKQHEACFAVKCIKKITIVEDDDYESILIERKVLALGNVNPFICKLFCTFETEGYLFFVMEFCAGGDLMFHVQRENKFSEPRCRFYAAEIICAIRFLHNRHIIYRDLKLDNILLDSSGHIRLVDFGMCQCRTYREEMLPSNFCGTPEYISPEIIKGVPYNHSVDWWSFGVLLYEMAVGKMPFRGNDENELLWNVCYEQIHYPLFLTRELTTLLQQLLEREPTKRMGMASCKAGDIKDQAWFKGTEWPAIEAMKVKPPFVPCVESKRDVQNFDADFTESQPQLSPVDDETLARIDQKQFQKFPYTNPEIQIFDCI